MMLAYKESWHKKKGGWSSSSSSSSNHSSVFVIHRLMKFPMFKAYFDNCHYSQGNIHFVYVRIPYTVASCCETRHFLYTNFMIIAEHHKDSESFSEGFLFWIYFGYFVGFVLDIVSIMFGYCCNTLTICLRYLFDMFTIFSRLIFNISSIFFNIFSTFFQHFWNRFTTFPQLLFNFFPILFQHFFEYCYDILSIWFRYF